MADTSSSTAPGNPTPSSPAAAKAKKHDPLRLLILVILLLLMAGALYYDRKIARPACEDAYQKVSALLQRELEKPGDVTASFDDVHKVLGRSPSQRIDEKYYSMETYTWRRGLLVRSYFIHVIYRKDQKGTLSLNFVTEPNQAPTEQQLPSGPVTPRPLTEEEKAALPTPTPGMPGGPTGPTSGPPGTPPLSPPDETPPKPDKPESAPEEKPAPAPAETESGKTPEAKS